MIRTIGHLCLRLVALPRTGYTREGTLKYWCEPPNSQVTSLGCFITLSTEKTYTYPLYNGLDAAATSGDHVRCFSFSAVMFSTEKPISMTLRPQLPLGFHLLSSPLFRRLRSSSSPSPGKHFLVLIFYLSNHRRFSRSTRRCVPRWWSKICGISISRARSPDFYPIQNAPPAVLSSHW